MKIPILVLTALLPAVAMAADPGPATVAINQLGLELFRQVAAASPGGNVVLSPFSIQSALAMTYAGAEGETRTEMARVLHFPADDAPLATDFAVLRAELDLMVKSGGLLAATQAGAGAKVDTIEWHLANRLFGQTGYQFRDPFVTVTRNSYGAPLAQLDFKTGPEAARTTINAWVGEQTQGKIQDLIPPAGVSNLTRLVLVNALYLKAPWQEKFSPTSTKERAFTVSGGQPVPVPTMYNDISYGHMIYPNFTAVAIPYLGGDLQFVILLPDAPDGVDALAAQVTPELLLGCTKLEQHKIQLYLPKFRLTPPTLPLGKMLQSLGMKQAFNDPPGSANFARMVEPQSGDNLGLAEIYHKTFVAVDEEGTEAAAATAAAMWSLGIQMPRPPEVHVDHPFLFAIQHRVSGACLFLGRVTDPR